MNARGDGLCSMCGDSMPIGFLHVGHRILLEPPLDHGISPTVGVSCASCLQCVHW